MVETAKPTTKQWQEEEGRRKKQWHEEKLKEQEEKKTQPTTEKNKRESSEKEQPGQEQEEERVDEEAYLGEFNQAKAALQDLTLPSKPEVKFPWVIFIIGLLNDICDLLQLTGIGIAATEVIDFLTVFIKVSRWLGKLAGGRPKSIGSADGLVGLGLVYVVEAIPIVGLLPTWTIQTLAGYSQEKKMAEQQHQQALANVAAQAAEIQLGVEKS